MFICLDPGHSGPVEPGACAYGYTEAAIVLDIAETAADFLTAAGHNVTMTRTRDIDTDDLTFRADHANNAGCDLFISIHCNAAESSRAQGTEVYYFPGSTQGAALAACLQSNIVTSLGTVDRGTKEADFQVLRDTIMPAALVECAFISNQLEAQMLAAPRQQRKIAEAIVEAVIQYIGV